MGNYKIISADDHIFEPPDMWTSRVEPSLKDRAPHIVRLDDGDDWWFTDGVKGITVASGAQTGLRFDDIEKLSFNNAIEEVRPGAYDPDERIKDMDLDGIDSSILYPNQGLCLFSLQDVDLAHVLMKTYNDWLAEYCKAHPDRLNGIGMVLLDDIDWGIQELKRCHQMGLVGAMISVYPTPGRGYHLPEYEPFWATVQDLGMPLSLHIGTNRPGSIPELTDIENFRPEFYSEADHWVRTSLAQMIMSGVFERYPKLTVGSVENDSSWTPYFLYILDYIYTQRAQLPHWHRFNEDMLPSDYFHRNCFVSFQEDELGIKYRDVIGVDNLQWGSDYPHPESTFPKTKEILETLLKDCTDEEQSKIAGANAARVYQLGQR